MKKRNQGNTTGKPPEEPKMIKLSLRVSEEFAAAVEKLAASNRTSTANVFRQLGEKGLRTVKEGDSTERLESSLKKIEQKLTNLESTTDRIERKAWLNQKILRILFESVRDLRISQKIHEDVIFAMANNTKLPDRKKEFDKARDIARDDFFDNVDLVVKNKDAIDYMFKENLLGEKKSLSNPTKGT